MFCLNLSISSRFYVLSSKINLNTEYNSVNQNFMIDVKELN